MTLFLEHLPHSLPEWLERDAAANDAIAMVERELRHTVALMNTAGLFHFDAHLDNILTDGHRLYVADFGLATSTSFELSPTEWSFVAANASHDACHTITRLVDWLVARFTDVPDWQARDACVAACAGGDHDLTGVPPAAAAVIRRYAPIAVVVNEFYRRLHLDDRRTPYRADAVRRAAATTGFAMPWVAPTPLSSG